MRITCSFYRCVVFSYKVTSPTTGSITQRFVNGDNFYKNLSVCEKSKGKPFPFLVHHSRVNVPQIGVQSLSTSNEAVSSITSKTVILQPPC